MTRKSCPEARAPRLDQPSSARQIAHRSVGWQEAFDHGYRGLDPCKRFAHCRHVSRPFIKIIVAYVDAELATGLPPRAQNEGWAFLFVRLSAGPAASPVPGAAKRLGRQLEARHPESSLRRTAGAQRPPEARARSRLLAQGSDHGAD